MKCKNCNHMIISIPDCNENYRLYHVSRIKETLEGIEIFAVKICNWNDEIKCDKCKNISFTEKCGCKNAEMKDKKNKRR